MPTKIIQLTAAKGPAECAWVVAKILPVLLKEVKENNIKHQIIQKQNGLQNRTIQSVSIRLEGKNSAVFIQNWLGTIQWIGTSKFRKYHKRKNWFIGCFEIENQQQQKVNLQDIEFQAIRSSGPGGQHVNKVSSAVRAKHIPTGTQVLVSESRSQHQNKKKAIERLQEKVIQNYWESIKNVEEQQWENHWNLQRGNPVRVFKGDDFKSKKRNKSFVKTRKQLQRDLRNQLK
jgi:peptide chain release factor